MNTHLWLGLYVIPLVSPDSHRLSVRLTSKRVGALAILLIVFGAIIFVAIPLVNKQPEPTLAGVTLNEKTALLYPVSTIFAVENTTGKDDGINRLINLMGNDGTNFYQSQTAAKNQGPDGIVGIEDVILIKVNSQWDERGGTNTDLLKSVIRAIINHPDGFRGEIIVADNGQAQYGPTGSGGSLAWSANNAEDTAQSVQRVVDSFAQTHKVSTYSWDTITTRQVSEYSEGDTSDGYVVNTTKNPGTGIMVSYPKFKTKYGTHVSFKMGIWHPEKKTYNDSILKVINMPVLKTHGGLGVTASVKHYMGVVSDRLTSQLGTRSHNTIQTGGMGTEMVETRFPVLNIVDAIWVNAQPNSGPRSTYATATRANIIAASTDPAALDYWASKQILLQVAKNKGFTNTSPMDPDNTATGSFGHWLRLSAQEMTKAGKQATVDEAHMTVYVSHYRTSP